jgi:hypothetical protein
MGGEQAHGLGVDDPILVRQGSVFASCFSIALVLGETRLSEAKSTPSSLLVSMSIPQAWGATALYFAAQNNQPKMVRMLLARDANPNGCVGALKKHPLIVAAKQGW